MPKQREKRPCAKTPQAIVYILARRFRKRGLNVRIAIPTLAAKVGTVKEGS